jgi:small subunit ribosomal protein S6
VAHQYDLMLLLDPNAPEGRGEQILADVRATIEDGGSMLGEHDWGVRKMSFEIRHVPEAHYELFQFEGDNDLLERISHFLKITDGVLRFRVIKLKPGSPPPPAPRSDAPPRPAREPREGRSGETRVAARAAADADTENGGEEGG